MIPSKAEELWAQLGAPGAASDTSFGDLDVIDVTGWRVRKSTPLFPKDAVERPSSSS
jgi:hypothetical protein